MRLEHVRTGSGEPLVLLHGIGDSLRAWASVLPLLAPHRECWAIDMPGFGRSPVLADGEPTPPALAAAVAGFMAAQGVERFHVAGNSTGGGVGLELGRSGVALSVCAISPIGFAEGRELWWLEISLRATRRVTELARPHLDRLPLPPPVRRLAASQMIFRADRVPADDLAGLVRDCALAPGFHATLAGLLAYRFEGTLPCPVTIAWGEHDRLNLYRPQSARARRRLPDATHVTLTGCGHLPTWDDPPQVAATILAATQRSSGAPLHEGAGRNSINERGATS